MLQSGTTGAHAGEGGTLDLDLHGVAGIRLFGAGSREAAIVERQIGPVAGTIEGDPDIVVRFVDRISVGGDVRLLGLDAGFTDDTFFVLRGPHKSRLRASIRFTPSGEPLEIVCERGASAVPLLIPLVNLVAIEAGVLPLHASAFMYEGRGVVATGWAKGGKTETLLGFMMRGASYVGDEWVYLLPDGGVTGVPEPVRVWDSHLEMLPRLRPRIGWRRLAALRALGTASAAASVAGAARGSGPARRVQALLDQQRNVLISPATLFGRESCVSRGTLDFLLFVVSHDRPDVVVMDVEPLAVARRMEFSLLYERLDLLGAFLRYRFAFPDAGAERIEAAIERQRELLSDRFKGRVAYELRHPFPAPIPAMVDAIEPILLQT